MQNNKLKIENICILRTSSLGDICNMLPFIYTLRSEYPNAKIFWIIGKSEANFLRIIDGIEFIVFDRNKTIKSYISIAKQLKKISFDIMFIMQVSLRANIISLFVNAKTKLGYDSHESNNLHKFFLNKKIPIPANSHVVDVFLNFLSYLNVEKNKFVYKWDITEKFSLNYLRDKYPDLNKKYFVLSPCSRNSNRNWLIERYADVADYININFGLLCVFSSSSDGYEKNFVEKIINKMNTESCNLSGKTDLHELLSLIKNSELLISPDSGPIHLATCVDRPVIGLYGVTNTVRAGPYKSKDLCIDKYNQALKKYYGLEPHEVRWRFKNNHRDAMSLITKNEVIKKINIFFGRSEN